MACTDTGFPSTTDHGVGNRRDESLHAQLVSATGRSLRFAAPDAVHPLGTTKAMSGLRRPVPFGRRLSG